MATTPPVVALLLPFVALAVGVAVLATVAGALLPPPAFDRTVLQDT